MEKNKNNFFYHKGRIFYWILILLAFCLVSFKFASLQELYRNIKQSNLLFISLAIFTQFFYFLFFALSYQIAFKIVNIKASLRRLFPLTFAYIFVNVAAPTFGASGPALFATEASSRKESPIRTLVGVLIANIAQFITFSIILIFGLGYLYSTSSLKAYQVVISLLMLGLTLGLVSIIVLAIKKPSLMKRYLHWQKRILNKLMSLLRRKKKFGDYWVEAGVSEFSDASKNIIKHKHNIKKLLLSYFVAHMINIVSLYFVFLAFNQPILVRALVAGFVIGIAFQIVGITPYGILLTESAMTLTFTSLGIPTETAILITLTYRGITFWLPFFIGFILLRKVHIFGINNVSMFKFIYDNKHVTNLKRVIKVRLVDTEKKT